MGWPGENDDARTRPNEVDDPIDENESRRGERGEVGCVLELILVRG